MSTQENRPFRAPYMTDASERTLYTFHPDRLFEVSVLDYLMLRFPRLTIEDISDGNHDRSCSICQIEYQTTYAEAKDHPVVDKGEQPIKLACGHVFGHDCLSRWLPKMTCPMCRQNLLYGHVTPHGKLKVRLGQAALLRDLQVADQLMSALHGHLDPAHTMYDFFQGPSQETAQIREMADRRNRAENPGRIRLDQENRQLHRRRDYQLFRTLLAEGVDFPRALTLDSVIEGYLEPRQEQALFEYLQQRGAFKYPNMDKFFQREPTRTDQEMYEMLRRIGLFWQPYGTWENAGGIMLFLSAELWKDLDRGRETAEFPLQRHYLRGMGHFPIGIDDVLDDNLGLEGDVQDDDGPYGVAHGPAITLRISIGDLVRQLFRSVVPRNGSWLRARRVRWKLSSILSNRSQNRLEDDDIDVVLRNNATWEVDLDLTE